MLKLFINIAILNIVQQLIFIFIIVTSMFKKILKILGKLHILKIGSYHVKGKGNKVIDAETSSQFSSSWFYGKIEEKIKDKEKEKNKSKKKNMWKGEASSLTRQKWFKGIGIVLLIFAWWFLIETLDAWPEWWAFNDIIIILFFGVWGILFLPFSYAWQEKHRWKNITQISIWLLIVLFFLTLSAFNVLFQIFSWDALYLWSILYILCVIFLWSLFLPVSLARRQKKYKKFDVLRRRYYIFRIFFVFFMILLVIDIGWSSDSLKSVATGDGKKTCLWTNQTPTGDARLTKTSFITHESENAPFDEVNKDIFNQEQLVGLWLYIEWEVKEDIWWSNWEICDLETNTILIPGDVMEYSSDLFPATLSNATRLDTLPIPVWNYAFNIFTSSDESWPWKLVRQIDFVVE